MKEPGINKFFAEREELNQLMLKKSGREIKRFLSIDAEVYREGALPVKTKELLGLVGSVVLRCDDCVSYHLGQLHKEKLTDAEVEEALSVALVVGGSITIPHLRRAFKAWEELKGN